MSLPTSTHTRRDTLLDELADTAQGIGRLTEERRALVTAAREAGLPWTAIGLALGTTGENARQRYKAFTTA